MTLQLTIDGPEERREAPAGPRPSPTPDPLFVFPATIPGQLPLPPERDR